MHEVISDSIRVALNATSSPQLPRAVLHGDRLDSLAGADGETSGGPAPAPRTIRAAVISIDGHHLRRREVRQRLTKERRDLVRGVILLPRLRHIIILLHVEPESERAATRSLDRAAHLAHVELEMRRSRDICITGIVITDGADSRILIQRLNERIRNTPIEGSYVVPARRILLRTISATAAEDLL